MEPKFDVSDKHGLNSKEGYIIYRGNEVFLRLLGGPDTFELMTATAGEDRRNLTACPDQIRLCTAALETSTAMGFEPLSTTDRYGRPYVKICAFRISDQGEGRIEAERHLQAICDTFFPLYDAQLNDGRRNNDLAEIYRVLAVDDSGSDVYLTDGVWLGSNGSTYDAGR